MTQQHDPDEERDEGPTAEEEAPAPPPVPPVPPTPPAVPLAAPAPTPVAAPAAPAVAEPTPPPQTRRKKEPPAHWWNRGELIMRAGGVAIVAILLGAILLWHPWTGGGDGTTDNGSGGTATEFVLTEDRVRQIATDEINKAASTDPSITESQVKELIDKAVADAMDTIGKVGGLTKAQVLAIVDGALKDALASAAPSATTTAQTGDSSCKGEKISTANEIGNAGPQRQEFGGGGYQLVDFYPTKGVKAVTYIVPPLKKGGTTYETASIGMGYGSIWEYNNSECSSYDFVPEATSYSQGRLGNGHTGLTIDLRGTTPKLVGNAGNLSQSAIEDVLSKDATAIQGWNLDAKQLASNPLPSR